jgi:hypothetical protein
MKASRLRTSCILLSFILVLGFVLPGCKKAAPPPQEPTVPPTSTQKQPAKEKAPISPEQAAKEKEFLSDPDVMTCELKETTISKLDLAKIHWPSFIRRMEQQKKEDVKQGQVTLANRPFKILLGETLEREFFLFDVGKQFAPYWWGSWSLHSYHKIDDQFFEFMLIEQGTKIAARPYKGQLGIIKVGKGGRDLEKVEFNGSVHQQGNTSAPIGTIEEQRTRPVAECQIPVGDYTPYLMKVTYDNLSIDISNNYHTNAQGQSRENKETVYGMQVREDKPYVLDFSNEPMVVFDQPPMSETSFSRGQEIKFAAVLIDPKLDIMIRGLDDTSVRKSLDPNVVITQADGKIVAEGVMPFG